MGNGIFCPECGKEQNHWKKNCSYCNTPLYTDDDWEKYIEPLNKTNEDTCINIPDIGQNVKKEKQPMFTDEQILVTGLYPKNSFFKGLLISRILGKK